MQGHKSEAERESSYDCVSHSDWNVFWAYFQQVSERFTVSLRNRQGESPQPPPPEPEPESVSVSQSGGR